MKELFEKLKDRSRAFAAATRAEELAGKRGPSEESLRIKAEIDEIYEQLGTEAKRLQDEYGITDELLDALEAQSIPEMDQRHWRVDVQATPVEHHLEEVVGSGLERLLSCADPKWLAEQSRLHYRQQYSRDSSARLHLVGRERLLPSGAPTRPQRYAEMLLICQDLVETRPDLDFFAGSVFAAEVAVLGDSLDLIPALGPEAEAKLRALSRMATDEVAATVYELLVGTACVRQGRTIEMLAANSQRKSPDFRVEDHVIPMVLECKRRDGLGKFTVEEAREVERLYEDARDLLERHHLAVEVTFSTEVQGLTGAEFVARIEALLETGDDPAEHSASWGTIRVTRLPITSSIEATRVFSPNYLLSVLGWDHLNDEWDGLLCEVDAPSGPVVDRVDYPRCLKWRCDGEASVLKKSRGVTSLWAKAAEQIPTGEMGGIYIAYTEYMRPEIADARTQHLINASNDWYVKRFTPIPLTVVSRLYSQATAGGGCDFIESAVPMVTDGAEHMLADFPSRVFTFRN